DVALNQGLEFAGDIVTLERDRLDAVNVNRRHRVFARTRQTDADVGVLALARSIDHAPHHRDVHVLYARIAHAPQRHLLTQITLNPIGQLLEKRAGRASATGTCD